MATKTSPEGLAAYVDVETTGLSPRHDEIIQLSIAIFRFDREASEILAIEDSYTGFQEPECGYVPLSATRINGIQFEDVLGHSLDDKRVSSLANAAEFIVAHNAQFDRSFIQLRYDWALRQPWKCSMRHVDWISKGFYSRKLQALLAVHRITVDTAHRADADVNYAIQLLNCESRDGTRYFREIIQHRPLRRTGRFVYNHGEVAASMESPTKKDPF